MARIQQLSKKVPAYRFVDFWAGYGMESKPDKVLLYYMYEDIEWTHKVLYMLEKMVCVPCIHYFYRDNPNSTVRTRSQKHYNDHINGILKSLEFVQRNNIKIRNLHQYHCTSKREYRIFNIPILSIKNFANYKRFYLFARFMFFEIAINYFDERCEWKFP